MTKAKQRRPSARRSSVRRRPGMDIIVESPAWKAHRGVRSVLQRAVREAAGMAKAANGELAIVLTDDAAVRALNRDWRGKDTATNVLSFPAALESPAPPPGKRRAGVRLLGDIVIAYETTAQEAHAEHKPFLHHLAHLAVHGYLHLAGYDHDCDAEAERMEALEIAVLRRLDVPNPYVPRDAKSGDETCEHKSLTEA
jgi:probable rRNA maturation factor